MHHSDASVNTIEYSGDTRGYAAVGGNGDGVPLCKGLLVIARRRGQIHAASMESTSRGYPTFVSGHWNLHSQLYTPRPG